MTLSSERLYPMVYDTQFLKGGNCGIPEQEKKYLLPLIRLTAKHNNRIKIGIWL
jgi:hypothetical protein